MNFVQGNPLDILQSASESTSYWNYRIHSTYTGCDRCAAQGQEKEKKKKLVFQKDADTSRNTLKS